LIKHDIMPQLLFTN